MAIPDARPERQQTDESLAVERAKADHALGDTNALLDERADEVIERARDQADDVLTAARAEADAKLSRPVSSGQTQGAIAVDRAREDELLRARRAKADEVLEAERRASARLLARLLPLERDKTDKYLLTERARSDDSLANRDDFLGMVSHDLRDLLNGIVLSASLIADAPGAGEDGKTSLVLAQRIQRSSARMGRLIGDLIDIASIDAGKLAMMATRANAVDVVAEAVETWGPPAEARGVALASSARGAVQATFDHDRVLQILGNLITNAVKFSPRGAKIVVGVEDVGGDVRFSVEDEGVGIPADKLDLIFERFWQVGKNDRRGLGLGLYISKCLVDVHGGRIWAESQAGAGSTFFFTLPAAR